MTLEKQDPARQRITRVFRSFSNSEKAVFFFSIALHFDVKPSDKVKNVAADGVSLYYNPEWVMDASTDDLQQAVAHSVVACALKHHTRRAGRETGKWNTSSRCATADILKASDLGNGYNPAGMYTPNAHDMSAEQIYDILPDDNDDDDCDNDDCEGECQGGGLGAVMDYPGEGDDKNEGDDDSGGNGKGSGEGSGEGDGQGSGNGNGPSQQEIDDQERDWDERLHQAAAIAKAVGSDPGRIRELIDDMHDSTMPWEDVLREFMTAVSQASYTWSRPNRRFVGQDIYLPSLHTHGMGPVVLAIDTSGSMASDTLAKVWSEIRAIVHDLHPEKVTVIECDAVLQSVTEYEPEELPDEYVASGRGGTSITPVFQHMRDEAENPACLIYYTDLEFFGSTWDDNPEPDYPVLWAAYDSPHESLTPPWGERLNVS